MLGGVAAAWPLGGRAQQPAMPVIGYLNQGSPESDAFRLAGLRQGLNQSGYVEGRNLAIEYRWAGNQADQLPDLAANLVQLRVAVIVTPGSFASTSLQSMPRGAEPLGASTVFVYLAPEAVTSVTVAPQLQL